MPDELIQARVLVVDDDAKVVKVVDTFLASLGFDVTTAGNGARAEAVFETSNFDLVLLDLNLPDLSGLELLSKFKNRDENTSVVMLSGTSVIDQAVEAMKRGAFDFVSKPFQLEELERAVRKAVHHCALRNENARLKRWQDHQDYAGPVFAESPQMGRLLRTAERVARSNSPVLIFGETGSGKGLIAKCVHRASARAAKAMVHINCGALPEQLVESELFGHERGAFTGAQQAKIGLFEVATGSSLFLDEIGELPLASQAKLLQVLDTGELRRVGGTQVRRVDARILAATNRNLEALVEQGEFREDLLYRLNVVELKVPPLRERREDLVALMDHYVAKNSAAKRPRRLSEPARKLMLQYHWPGNVRELAHVIESACVLAADQAIYPEDLRIKKAAGRRTPEAMAEVGAPVKTLREAEKDHIRHVLESTKNNRSLTARLLEIDVKTLRKKIRDYELA